jgi:hypothetical protein
MDPDITRARFAVMSDLELARVLGAEREDYVPEALALARAEFSRRGVYRVPIDDPVSQTAVPASRSFVWVDVYAAFVAMASVGGVAVVALAAFSGSVSWGVVAGRAVFGGLLLAFAIGLRARRAWAWWANWLLLLAIALPVAASGHGLGLLVAALWFVPNAAYFWKRKGSFGRGGSRRVEPG